MFKKDCHNINKKKVSAPMCSGSVGIVFLRTKVYLCALALLSVTSVNILR